MPRNCSAAVHPVPPTTRNCSVHPCLPPRAYPQRRLRLRTHALATFGEGGAPADHPRLRPRGERSAEADEEEEDEEAARRALAYGEEEAEEAGLVARSLVEEAMAVQALAAEARYIPLPGPSALLHPLTWPYTALPHPLPLALLLAYLAVSLHALAASLHALTSPPCHTPS